MPTPDLVIRPAAAPDVERVAEIQHRAPGPELVGLFGSVERARRFGMLQVHRDGVTNPAAPILVACCGDAVVGMLEYRWRARNPAFRLADAILAVRVLGPARVLGLAARMRARGRVDHPIPPDAFYIAEIHVDPGMRGRGIGTALLDLAADVARRCGAREIVLTTTSTNPARRLYERAGYAVLATRTDPAYAKYSGSPGRVLMGRVLAG